MKNRLHSLNGPLAPLALAVFHHLIAISLAAATFTVSNTYDAGTGSLRQAIQNAAAGDTISFSVTGTITLTNGKLLVAKNLNIVGPGASSLAVSGHTNSRVLEINSNITASISGLTIRGGHAPDGAVSGASGAGGGGIYNAGTLILTSCVVSSNSAGNGHGYVAGVGLSGGGGGFGGGIYNAGTLMLFSCTVSGNVGGGGGQSVMTAAPVGGAGGRGGGIYNGGTLALASSTVSGNAGGAGGGGGASGGPGGPGGGVYNAGTAIVTDCTLNSNLGGVGGVGGIRVLRLGSFWGQLGGTGGDGGGLYNAESVTLTACTLTGNAAGAGGIGGYGLARAGDGGSGGNGGAVCNAADASVAIFHNSLIASDRAGAGGTAGRRGSNLTTPGHAGSTGAGPDLYGVFTSEGHNLVGQTDGSMGVTNRVNGDLAGSTAAPLDPRLGPLQNNGGPTPTMALLAGSPAVDAGDDALLSEPLNLTTDQRGLPRRSGAHVDIGAFESQVGALVAQTPNLVLLAAQSPNQPFRFTIVAPPGAMETIEASSDLRTWTVLTNFLSTGVGTYEFIDASPRVFPQRFYRLRSP